MASTIEFPTPEEYNPYFDSYVQRARGGDILETLTRQLGEIQDTLSNVSEPQAHFRPAPHEWSIKEVLGHINDAERIFFYRALCVSRGEAQSLPGFDQDEYVRATDFNAWNLAELIQEFTLVRQANILSLKHFSTEAGLQRGLTNGNVISTRALIHIMAGHVYHHLESLQTVYLPAL